MSIKLVDVDADKTDEVIVTPGAGKKIHLWHGCVDNSSGASETEIKIDTLSYLKVAAGEVAETGKCSTGLVDKTVTLTAPANSKIDLHYEEVD